MAGLAAGLPDPLVRIGPGRDRRLDLFADQLPVGFGAGPPQRFLVQVDRVEQRAPDVVLVLVVGAVADPHRSRPAVAPEVVEGALGQVLLAADPVHDLQVRVLAADFEDEFHERLRLLAEAERVQGPEAEGGVADPAVAVVPVPFPAGRLRQRGGRRGDDRPGRGVGQPLQDQRRALKVDPPGMVREAAGPQPLSPELFGRVEPLERLRRASRPAEVVVPPGHRAEPGLVLAEVHRPGRRPAVERELHVRGQAQLGSFAPRGRSPRRARLRSTRPPRPRRRTAARTPCRCRPRRRCRSSPAATSGRPRAGSAAATRVPVRPSRRSSARRG